jgi:hypothetical protein
MLSLNAVSLIECFGALLNLISNCVLTCNLCSPVVHILHLSSGFKLSLTAIGAVVCYLGGLFADRLLCRHHQLSDEILVLDSYLVIGLIPTLVVGN